MGEFGEHFAEAGHVQGDAATGYYQGDGNEYHDDSDSFAEGHPLAEYGDSEDYGCYRLEGTEYGGGSGADVLDCAGGAQERYGGREYRKGENVEPHVPSVRSGEFHAGQQSDDEKGHTEDEYVECDCQCRCVFQGRLVYAYYVYGVGEC